MLVKQGDFDTAIATLSHACTLDPKLASAWYNLGLVFVHSVRPADAVDALRRAVALVPGQAAARVLLADVLRASGDFAMATTEYRRVIAQQPNAGAAWWGLANLKTLKLDEHDIAAIRVAMQRPRTSDDDLIALGFALAKALDDAGRYAESLAALAEANVRARRRAMWNSASFSTSVDEVLAAFGAAPSASDSTLGRGVIFVASMPRSGSTLVEQILASHSLVEGAGELPDVPLVLTEESQRRGQPFAHWAKTAAPDDWARLGRRYLERTAHWRERKEHFTDKLPNNWFYLGAIRAMLPAARIVIVRRDPIETCLSCYRQHFSGHEYTRTFSDLAAYRKDFDRAVRTWRERHPNDVHELVYEDLVAAPEAATRTLLAFCGLDFEPACLQFHETVRDVHTASAAQVREPLRRDTARAHRYGALLDPLRGALGLPAFAQT